MSKQVDERVVSMQFDNKQFEANVKTSMSTIDKLKEKLNFNGASKGLENVNAAAKKVDMAGLSSSVETVRSRFSALEVMGVTALANITNSAVNAGKRIVSALTIDPVRSGFNEYELKMGSVQTIMASTGESLETVNKYLNELNKYSDDTIYSFQDMTQNIGKFTNAGVKLEDAVAAIKGISNEAAVSGANANEASRAMYNFAQALSSGYVKLIDWKSIELANMATVEFKNQLIETAVATGTLKKTSDGMYKTLDGTVISATKNFNESLQDQWMTSEVLITTLGKYADETTEIGKKATQAATEVKTFSQLMDTLKESAQSGWAQTWEIIFGDFNEGKNLWTTLSKSVGGFLDRMSDARNALLEGALGSKWDSFNAKIEEAGISTETFGEKLKEVAKEEGYAVDDLIKKHGSLTKAIASGDVSTNIVVKTLKKLASNEKDAAKSTEDMTDKLEYFQKVVNKVWHGDYANGEARVKALTEAGYDYAAVQELVNKTVDGHKLTLDDLSDAQLKSVGYTEEQIKSIRELAEEAEKTGTPLNELIASLDKPSGRELLIDSFKNAFQGLGAVLGSVKKAWNEIFNPSTTEERAASLYKLIENINKFSEHLRVNEETADKFKRTFKGVFAILDVISTFVMGPIKIAFKLLTAVLGEFDLNILDLTARLGDGLVAFRDWIKGMLNFDGAAKTIADTIRKAIKSFKEWVSVLKESDNIPRDIVKGLIKGFGDGIKTVASWAREIANTIINTVKKLLGIHSPSTVFMEIGKNIIDGLMLGLQNVGKIFKNIGSFVKSMVEGVISAFEKTSSKLFDTVKTFASKFLEFIKNIDFGTVLAGVLIGGTLFTIKKVADVVETVMDPFEDIGIGVKRLFTGMGKMFAGVGWELKTHAMMNLAKAILILVGALLLLTLVEPKKLWGAIGAVVALTAILSTLAITMSKMGDSKDIFKKSLTLVGISATLLILAFAIKKLASVKLGDGVKALGMLAVAVLGVGLILLAIERVIRYDDVDYARVALMMLGIGLALKIILSVINQAASLEEDNLIKGMTVLGILSAFCFVFISVSRLAGKHADKAGKMLLKMSFALLIMVAVIKIAGNLKPDEIFTGLMVMAALEILCIALTSVSKLAGEHADEAGKMLIKFGAAMFIMAFALKIMSTLDTMDVIRGIAIIVLLGVFCTGLVAVSKLAGEHAASAGSMMFKISVAILVLTGAIYLLGLIPTGHLAKGLLAVGALSLMIGGLIAVTGKAKDSKGMMRTLIMLAVIFALLAAVMAGLTMLDQVKLATASASLAGVMIALSLLIGITKFSKNTKDVRKTLTELIIITGLLALIVAGLSYVSAENAVPNTIALSVLLVAFAASIAILGKAGRISTTVNKHIGPMLLVVLALAAIVAGLSLVPMDETIIEKVIALSLLMASFAAMMVGLSYATKVSIGLSKSIIPMLIIVAGLALIVGLLSPIKVEGSLIEKTVALSILLLAFSGALVILAHLGPVAAAATPAIPPLLLLIAGIAAIVIALTSALGALMKADGFKQILADGGEALGLIGTAIGKFVGGIAGGIAAGAIDAISTSLPNLGTALSEFMKNASDFISGIENFKPESVKGVKALAETILILTAANILDGIARFFGAESSLEGFAAELPTLGTGLQQFVANLGTFGDDQVKTVTCAANAIKNMAQAAEAIPNEGGWIAKICGDNSISTFGGYLPALGTHLSEFATNLGTFTDEQVNTVSCAAKAVKEMATAAEKIPNEGGWWAKLTGDNSIETFGGYLPGLGTNLASFATNLGTFGDAQIATVTCAATAVQKMAEAAEGIPASGGWWQKLVGDKGLDEFGGQLPSLGEHLKGFVEKLGTMSEGAIATTQTAVKVIKALTGLANANMSGAKKQMGEFGKETITFAENLKTFCSKISAIDSAAISTACDNVYDLLKLFRDLENVSADSVAAFSESLKSIGKTGVSQFIKAFDDASEKVKDAGKKMMENLSTGAQTKSSDISSDFKKIAGDMAGSMKEKYQEFYNAGSYLVSGFIAGINDNIAAAAAKAASMAAAAEAAAKAELDINSPSKVFREIGTSIPEGFAQGITKLGSTVRASTVSMSDTAVDGVKSSIAKIADAINSDIDAQPTIRPVLDLSDIESGAGSINNMLGFGTSVGIMSNLNAINSSMNRRNQNGANKDVVSAIDKLRTDLNNMDHASYTINGITYGEGSDVAEAIQTIVRAARVERRV